MQGSLLTRTVGQPSTIVLSFTWIFVTIFHQAVWGVIFVMYLITRDDPTMKNVANFVNTIETIKYITVYSGYWIMVIMVALTTAIMPMFPERAIFNSFYTANGNETPYYSWMGWFVLFWYVALVTLDSVV